MSKIEKQSAALAVFSTAKLPPDSRNALIEVAKSQLTTLVNHRQEAPYRAILTGLTLHRIKADCVHGEWMPVYEQILKTAKFCTPKTAQVYCSQWMRAATLFLAETDAAKPEFIELSGRSDLSVETTGAVERKFMKKLQGFIDGRSLDELLTDLNLRNAAATKRRKLGAAETEPAADEQEKSAQDLFNELEEHLQLASKTAADKTVWMRLSKRHHEDLLATARSTYERISALYSKTHGRKAK